jgi:PLP dependent protein
MQTPANRQHPIAAALSAVLANINRISPPTSPARLVAVSKYIPADRIQTAYDHGQRHFGENYVQELISKSAQLPGDIKWHFIGSLQSNKCKVLVDRVPNLWCVETLDSERKARLLETAAAAAATTTRQGPLKVFVQVNTSGEERMVVDGMGGDGRERRGCFD